MRRLITVLFAVLVAGCDPLADAPMVGEDGDPRFNLYFNNELQVDLDLHVVDPDGEEIYWKNQSAESGGVLETDCKCSTCSNGPSEDIAWTDPEAVAPSGTYTLWVAYYGACENYDGAGADFLVRTARDGEVIDSFSGELWEGESERWEFVVP